MGKTGAVPPTVDGDRAIPAVDGAREGPSRGRGGSETVFGTVVREVDGMVEPGPAPLIAQRLGRGAGGACCTFVCDGQEGWPA